MEPGKDKAHPVTMQAAPAKVNLALAVTGRRDDGYHLIDTFVVFTEFGDEVRAATSEGDRFVIDGRYAPDLDGGDHRDNLVLKARDGLRALIIAAGGEAPPVSIALTKRLPVASGIGGGSADAAATLRLLCLHWDFRPDRDSFARLAISLGADVPMCLEPVPVRARGIGEVVERAMGVPSVPMVLANPGVAVSTPAIFKALEKRDNPTLTSLPGRIDARVLSDWTKANRNDLKAPAVALAPEIGHCLELLGAGRALAAGMSGSGATCFGLYATQADAEAAAAAVSERHPGWFVVATRTLPSVI